MEEHLVGELIASEARSGPDGATTHRGCGANGEAPRPAPRARRPARGRLGGTGTHPWSPWQEQRIIDTPHYRENDEILRYVLADKRFGLHVHVGVNGPDRAVQVCDWLRHLLPEISHCRHSPFHESVFTHLHSRGRDFTKFFRVRDPGCLRRLADLRGLRRVLADTGSITEHTQLWWSVGRISRTRRRNPRCRRPAELGEARSLAAFSYALARADARALDDVSRCRSRRAASSRDSGGRRGTGSRGVLDLKRLQT